MSLDLGGFLSRAGAVVAMNVRNGYWVGGVEPLTRAATAGQLPWTSGARASGHVPRQAG